MSMSPKITTQNNAVCIRFFKKPCLCPTRPLRSRGWCLDVFSSAQRCRPCTFCKHTFSILNRNPLNIKPLAKGCFMQNHCHTYHNNSFSVTKMNFNLEKVRLTRQTWQWHQPRTRWVLASRSPSSSPSPHSHNHSPRQSTWYQLIIFHPTDIIHKMRLQFQGWKCKKKLAFINTINANIGQKIHFHQNDFKNLVKFFFAQQLGFSPTSGGGQVQSLCKMFDQKNINFYFKTGSRHWMMTCRDWCPAWCNPQRVPRPSPRRSGRSHPAHQPAQWIFWMRASNIW